MFKIGDKVRITRQKVIKHFAAIDCGPNGVITEIISGAWIGSTAARQRQRVRDHPHGYRIAFDDLVARHGEAFKGNVYAIDEFKRR